MSVYVNHYTYGKQFNNTAVLKSLISKDMIEFSWKRINKESILQVTFFYRFLINIRHEISDDLFSFFKNQVILVGKPLGIRF